MYWLSEDALLVCDHEAGYVQIVATQNLVTINGLATVTLWEIAALGRGLSARGRC